MLDKGWRKYSAREPKLFSSHPDIVGISRCEAHSIKSVRTTVRSLQNCGYKTEKIGMTGYSKWLEELMNIDLSNFKNQKWERIRIGKEKRFEEKRRKNSNQNSKHSRIITHSILNLKATAESLINQNQVRYITFHL